MKKDVKIYKINDDTEGGFTGLIIATTLTQSEIKDFLIKDGEVEDSLDRLKKAFPEDIVEVVNFEFEIDTLDLTGIGK